MQNRFVSWLLLIAGILIGSSVPVFAGCSGSPCGVTNSNAITLSATASAPALDSSAITVTGFSSTSSIAKATVTLNNWTGTDGGNVNREFFLVYTPNGSSSSYSYQFLAELGDSNGFSNVTITFDDGALAGSAPVGQTVASNNTYTYLPTVGTNASYSQSPGSGLAAGNNNFAAPFGTATFGSVFGGLAANGTWTLYAYDASSGDAQAAIAGGWTITVTAAEASTTSTSVTSSAAETFIGDNITFTATVANTANSSLTVSAGTVTFTDTTTGTALGSSVVSNGKAILDNVTFSTEGNHNISAQYNGDANFGASSSSINVFLDHATSVNGPTFCNTGPNSINTMSGSAASASVYPQHVFVSGLTGSLTGMSLQLSNLQNIVVPDLNVLLVGPSGATQFVALAGAGSAIQSGGSLTLSDFGGPIPISGLGTGPYLPTDATASVVFGLPAPAGPYALAQPQGSATFATTFASELNGAWSLYVYDSKGGDSAGFGGYCLAFTTSSVAASTTALNASAATAMVGEEITFTATATSNGSPVTGGTVTFKENGNVLSGPTAVDANGAATYQSSSLAEGVHTLTAVYSGLAGTYNISSASASVEVDAPTTISGPGVYCNTDGITFPASGSSAPYPSRVNVTNLPGTVNAVTVTLNGLTNTDPTGIGMLLTGPSATNIVLWKEAGGATAVNGDNITLDDAAGSTNPIAFPLPASGSYTYFPTATTAAGAFPAPAPANASYAPPAGLQTLTSAFQNLNGNGYWSLYTSGAAAQTGSIGSWCLNFTQNPPVLSVGVSGPTTLTQGQTGAQYTITVTNNGPGPTGGATPISVTELSGPGLTVTGMNAIGWDCSNLPVCTSTAVIPQGGTSTITAIISVNNNAGSPQTNGASVSGGGSLGTVTDPSPLSITILAPTTSVASNAAVAFSPSAQNVLLSAAITASGATVNGGTVTFSVSNAGTPIGVPVTSGTVANGGASATFVLPAGAAPGTYTIQAMYNGAGSFVTSSDSAHTLTVNAAGTTVAAINATASFSPSVQNVALAATVTSATGPVNGGTVTFTILNGGTLLGSPVTSGTVTNGNATATYSLPAGTAAGAFVILAVYNAGADFASSSDATHSLTVSGASTTVSAGNATATFSSNAQNITLSATVTSAAGQVNSGAISFAIFNNGTQVGSSVTSGALVNGSASAVFVLPAGTAVGSYSIQATFNGVGNFASSNDSAHTLTIGPAATTLAAANASATFNSNAQNVTLSVTVTSAAGTVNSGTVSFTVSNNGTPVGNPVTSGTVTNGAATATYALPAGTAIGSYSISASYSGGGNFAANSDSTHNLSVGAAATTIAASNASATFSPAAQNVTLSASVTSAAGTVNAGTVTFTIVNNGTPVGTAVTSGTVANGNASATYSLPALMAVGSYTIQAIYNAGGNFTNSSDNAHDVTVNGAATTVTASNTSATFSPNAQNLTLSATVTSAAGTVNAGSVTFMIVNNGTQLGLPVTSSAIANGGATVIYSLPGGTAAGTYTIQALYNAGGNFATNSDGAHTLTVGGAVTTLAAANATASFSANAQNVSLSATLTSTAGTVNAGTVTFTLLSGTTAVGTAVTSSALTNGSAAVSYSLPAGTVSGIYTIQAVYNAGGNFAGSSDSAHTLSVTAPTVTMASNASAIFSPSAQNITLSASVTSTVGAVNDGVVTFTILNGSTPVGSAVTSSTVTGGSASATYSIPAGTAAGAYVIQAVYNAGGNFATSSDSTHGLTIGGAATSITAGNASATFNSSAQSVTLSATVSSAAGTVNGGTVTFTILNGGTPLGSAVTSPVVANGNASAIYSLPGGTGAGTYAVQAIYNPGGNFAGSSDNSHNLSVNGAATAIAASNASATFSPNVQNVTLSATVTSAAGTVNAGTVTFTLLNGGNLLGSPITSGTVTNGIANATFSLPAGTITGTYTMVAVYNAGWNFMSSSDATHNLTVSGAVTTTLASSASATFNPSAQNVTLSATVTSTAGAMNAGTVTFTISNNGTTIGAPATSATLANGSAVATYSLPSGTAAGTYIIQAAYSGGGNFAASTDGAHTLIVGGAATTIAANNVSATFSPNAQDVMLSASLVSAAGTVNGGTITFTVSNGGSQIGSAVTSPAVANGSATVIYSLPGGTAAGTYTILAAYNGGGNFAASTDNAHALTISGAATTVAAANATATFNPSTQNVTLTATVTSAAGTVNAGSVTFAILNGAAPIGNPVTSAAVVSGNATVTYSLPGGIAAGTYTIQAAYNAGGNFAASNDGVHTLTINGAATVAAASNASATFNPGVQNVTLSATVTSTAGIVNGGTITFSAFNGATSIGVPVTSGTVTNGAASAVFALPGGTGVGAYTIQAAYSGGGNFAGSSDTTHVLAVTAAATTISASNASANFNTNAQNITLSATVLSTAGAVGSGTVTFTILNGSTVIGSPVTSIAVTNGAAMVSYSLPAGTVSGTYTIQAVYNAAGNFTSSSDTAHSLTVSGPTTTAGSNASTVYGSGIQNVTLSATVTSTAGVVNAGTVTFSVYSGATLIGASAISGTVSNGSASAIYSLPTGTSAGTYTIQAAYSGGGIFSASSDATHTLTVNGAISATRGNNASATFSPNNQSVALSASVSSPVGLVSAGTVTFTVLNGNNAIGSPVTVNTVGGNASAIYILPGAASAGTYTIQAIYNGAGNFAGSADSTGVLTVSRAATTLAENGASATFSPNSQNVTLSATVLSAGVTVNGGTVTFTVSNNGTALGSPVTSGIVAGGAATATYSLPGGAAIGAYTIQAVYNGAGNFTGSSDNTQLLTVGGAATTTTANNILAAFSASAQNVTLSATVTSAAGIVNSGSVSFTVLTPVASTVTGNVANGSASVTYSIPAGTTAGTYTVQAIYNSGGNFASSSDVAHAMTISTAPSTTAASNVSATFGSNVQNLTLSAAVSSAAGTVNSGTVTFTILNFGTPIGSPVTSGVVTNGNASATYSLPGGTPEGTYSIQSIYSGVGNFAASSETAHTVTVGPAATTILGSAATAGFSPNAQNVTFSATVTSTAGTVNTGTVTFTLLNGGMPVGTPVTSSVVTTGRASVTYLLPGGTGLGMYTILAAYNAGWDFTSSSDGTHSLTVTGAATTIAANNASTTFSANAQNVTLSAAVTSAAGTVNGGTVTFTVWNGTTEIGAPTTSTTVANGAASATYVLPANTPPATYEIQAAYSGGSFAASSDAPVTLTVMAQPGALMFVPVTPCRVADTRNATGPFGGPQMAAGSTRNFAIPASGCGIPSTALAYSLNTTVIPNVTLGYLTMWPAGQTQPNVSTLNSFDGRIKANAAIVPAGTNGAVSIYVTDATQVILDIDGYYVPAGTPSSLAFYPMTPCRVADTRQGTGPLAGPSLGGGSSRTFPILSSSCNIPSTAQAYSMNFTAVPAGPLFYITTWATGQAQPTVSTLNAPTGTVTANAAIVPAGTNGSLSVYTSDPTDLVLDIDGYFAPPGTGGLSLYTLTPCRVLDTRSPAGAQPFNGMLAVNVGASACGVPATAKAYGLNATVVPPAPLTYLTLWADGQSQPVVSTLNALDGAITSNMAIVPTTDGSISAFASNATHLILDISSYYAP